MNGPGAMHSKLQLLKYPDYLRVVVPSANLVPYDWGETGVMENVGCRNRGALDGVGDEESLMNCIDGLSD
jgi:hypothetical protein